MASRPLKLAVIRLLKLMSLLAKTHASQYNRVFVSIAARPRLQISELLSYYGSDFISGYVRSTLASRGQSQIACDTGA